jgi:periplasmic protein TonB
VLVRVAVGLDGRAVRVEVLRSSGSALLDKAAVEALERWRFEPARAAGQPVAATVEIPVTFRLTDPDGS